MRQHDAFVLLLMIVTAVSGQTTQYCGDCGCFGQAEYLSLLAIQMTAGGGATNDVTGGTAGGATIAPASSLETGVVDGVTLTAGASQVFVDGSTYAIGPGVLPVTVLIDAESFSFGPSGVGAAGTTIPFTHTVTASPTTNSTMGNIVANSSVTLLVPNPATASGSTGGTLGHTSASLTGSVTLLPPASSLIPTTVSASTLSAPTATVLPPPPPMASSSTTATTQVFTPSAVPSSVPIVETTDLNSNFVNTVLQYTNYYRSINQAAPVSWDPVKALYAQTYANECNFQHSRGPYGENLAIGGYSNPAFYIWYWYDEIMSVFLLHLSVSPSVRPTPYWTSSTLLFPSISLPHPSH